MSIDIRLKHSATANKAPQPADLKDGELALNTNAASPAAYIKDSAGNIVKLAGAGAITSDWTRTGTTLAPKTAGDVVEVSAGTAALPGLTPVGDDDTGLFFPGANQLALSVAGTEHIRIWPSGEIAIGEGDPKSHMSIRSDNSVAGPLSLNKPTTTGKLISFYTSSAFRGDITTDGSTVAYNTSSDYRLKENVTPVSDGITRLQQLKPSRFNFIANPGKTVDGFIAHEVQSVVPEAVTGQKDAVDDEGNPVYQGIDQSKLLPLLTAALQEAIGEIESLKARVAALETP